jgi:hypothetical protein
MDLSIIQSVETGLWRGFSEDQAAWFQSEKLGERVAESMTLQVVKLAVKVGQRLLQHPGVPWVVGGFELLQDTETR